MNYCGIELPNPFKKSIIRKVNKKKQRNLKGGIKESKVYEVFYYNYTDETGKRHQISTGKTSLKESKNEIIRRYEEGTLLGVKNPKISFKEFSKPFWVWDTCPIVNRKLEKEGHFSKSFCKNNRYQMEKYISPFFDNFSMTRIKKENVEEWKRKLHRIVVDERTGRTLNNKTCNHILRIFRQMMEEGVRQKLITTNPCKDVEGFYVNQKETKRKSFTDDQIRSLFETTWEDKMSYVSCLLSCETGMRLGEIRGLMVEQIKEDYIEVNSSWSDIDGRKSTKNGLTRNVPITPELRDLLLSISPKENGLIFTLNGTKPVKDTTITDVLKKEMKKRGIEYDGKELSFHSFRKYYNSLLLTSNVQGDLIRSIMGHQSIEMTDRYTDTSQTKRDKELINRVVNSIGWVNPYKEEDDEEQLSLFEEKVS